jgi:DNA-binding MarR family transcriptional regulator
MNTAIDPTIDTEFIILENIYGSSGREIPLRQRDLAQIAGTSLGMTNSILKRLAQRGWISIKKLNSRNIRYAVTLEGINEIARRGYGYFKRTIRNVVYYRENLEELIRRAKRKNVSTVLLAGISDLDFIVEHLCQRYGLSFLKAAETKTALQALDDRSLAIFAENIPGPPEPGEGAEGNVFYLSRMVMKNTPGELP